MKEVPLNEIADVVRGVTFGKSDASGLPSPGKLPILRAGNISERLVLDEDLVYVSSSKVGAEQYLRTNDILMCTSSGSAHVVGKTAISEGDWEGSFGAFCAAIRVKNDLADSRFVWHFLRSPDFRKWTSSSAGIGIKNIRSSELQQYSIPIPPIDQQKRIAAVLDQADNLRRLRHRAIDRLNKLRQAVFYEMFGDPSQDKTCPQIQLADVVRTGTIVTYGIVQAGEEFEGGVPYIRTGDIDGGEIQTTKLRHTDPIIAARFERSRVDAGDIVMSIRATVGTTAIVPAELDGANLTQGTARIAPGEKCQSAFLLEYLRSPSAQNWIARQVKGATFREITLGKLRELEVPIPPIALQEQFAQRSAQIDTIRAHAAAHLRTANSLFSALQDRAFRGEL